MPGQHREGLEPAGHADSRAGGVAEPQAPGQVPPGLLDRAEVHGHPPQPGQAARDFGPGADLPQDGQGFHVPAVRLARVMTEPGQVPEAEQGPGGAPLLVDPPHHGDRGSGQLLGLAEFVPVGPRWPPRVPSA